MRIRPSRAILSQAEAFVREGRAPRGAEAGGSIRGFDVSLLTDKGMMLTGSKEVGDFAILQNLRLF